MARGRPTKLTPEVHERIVQAVKAGNYVQSACRFAGVSTSTYYRWLDRASEEPGSAYARFRYGVEKAEAEAEVYAVAIIRKAMPGDWRAALAFLERRHPRRWRPQSQTELVGRDGGPIQTEQHVDLSKLSTEEVELLRELTARVSSPD